MVTEVNIKTILDLTEVETLDTFVDIGAAKGIYSAIATKMGFNTIHCFEPRPETNIETNLPDAIIHRCVVSDIRGKIKFYSNLSNLQTSSVFYPHHIDVSGFVTDIVPVSTLDSFDIKDISLIKIDVEGNELKTLKGAENTLRNTQAGLLIEISKNHNEVVAFLKELGYEACGFHVHNTIYDVRGDLQFFDNPSHSEQIVWSCGHTNFSAQYHKRELERDQSLYNYNKEYFPIWGDFIFRKKVTEK